MKTIHYLSGLPRSGNTVLSALLNQNPILYSSPLSPLSHMMYTAEINCVQSGPFIRTPNYVGLGNVLKNMPQNYYNHIEQNIIFDRDKTWTTPNNLNRLINLVNPNPKIIFTVRNTLDILKSFLLQNNNNNFFLETKMEFEDYYPRYYLEKNDAICDYVLTTTQMKTAFLALYTALRPENRKYVHFVEYDNLINNPKDTMQNLYKFLEIDYFNHDFYNIKAIEINNESAVNAPQTLHEIQPVLKFYSPNVDKVLSEYIIQKYKNADLWKKLI
jgi:sulfotransferase